MIFAGSGVGWGSAPMFTTPPALLFCEVDQYNGTLQLPSRSLAPGLRRLESFELTAHALPGRMMPLSVLFTGLVPAHLTAGFVNNLLMYIVDEVGWVKKLEIDSGTY